MTESPQIPATLVELQRAANTAKQQLLDAGDLSDDEREPLHTAERQAVLELHRERHRIEQETGTPVSWQALREAALSD